MEKWRENSKETDTGFETATPLLRGEHHIYCIGLKNGIEFLLLFRKMMATAKTYQKSDKKFSKNSEIA